MIVDELKRKKDEVKRHIEEELQNQEEEETKRKDPEKMEEFEAALKRRKEREVARRQKEELLNKLTVFIFELTYFTLLHLFIICGKY